MNKRIGILDRFRFFAVISVVLFHFFSKQHINHVNNQFDTFDCFKFGNLGVHFFFMISGYVIVSSLHRTKSFLDFFLKRMIRLFPSMLIASLLIVLIKTFFGKSGILINDFIGSISFVSPNLLKLFGFNFNYLNISYWSLWPEIQFYLFAGSVYFIFRNYFLSYFLSLSVFIISICYLIPYLGVEKLVFFQKTYLQDIFNLYQYLSYFVLGVVFFYINNKHDFTKYNKFLFIVIVFFSFYTIGGGLELSNIPIKIIFLLMFLVFVGFTMGLSVFKGGTSFFDKLGMSSYFVYLIHEPIGLLLLQKIYCFNLSPWVVVFLSGMMIFLIFVLSHLYSVTIEKKLHSWLSKLFFMNREESNDSNI